MVYLYIYRERMSISGATGGAPFLKLDFGCIRSSLRSDELLEITDSIVWATFHSYWAWLASALVRFVFGEGADLFDQDDHWQ